ncbi:MAG TPA: gliding motility-associated C-terminal domain-containing protein [Flavipsychrobacter sp.]|nr:gliding motility-associated C-terminal domain-containing protein [Flavipsychrobacter sp.]
MRKSLLVLLLLACSQLHISFAQESLFSAPDSVCVRQPIYLADSFTTPAESYYWGFCSGYIYGTAQGINWGPILPGSPSAIEVAKDGEDYYKFIAVKGATSDQLIKFEYGKSLSNIAPTIINMGTLSNVMPIETSKLFLTKDKGNWHLFICGGTTPANSSIVRLDFGDTLGNTPNIVNMGNLFGLLNKPRGIFVQEEAGEYFGYVVNQADNKLLRLLFGKNISNTPVVVDLGAGFGFNAPSDMVHVLNEGSWYVFVPNQAGNNLTRLDFGASIATTPTDKDLGDLDGRIFGPNSVTFVRDCNNMHLFFTNVTTDDMSRVDFPTVDGPFTGANYTGFAGISSPTAISRVIRDRDSIFAYVTNGNSNSYSQIYFPQCYNSSIASSTEKNPPVYSYDQPGLYNVYLAVNEGRADMQIECKQIEVLPLPPMTVSRDTGICQGDTIQLSVVSPQALTYVWTPNYRIDTIDVHNVKVAPEFTVKYHLQMSYSTGCIVDTGVLVEVSKNKADAGPDRIIADGAKTTLGGPLTTMGANYTLTWTPNQFINDLSTATPVVTPPFDFTYYLEVTNTDGCYSIDSVIVHVDCNDINVPNAFSPESPNAGVNRVGVMNRNIVKLNSFSIYDRWGRQVFFTTDITNEWDGKVNGKPAPFGVYVWEADGFCAEGRRFRRSGNVTLIR